MQVAKKQERHGARGRIKEAGVYGAETGRRQQHQKHVTLMDVVPQPQSRRPPFQTQQSSS